MADGLALYPFEIIVQGTPVSLQATNRRNLERWKETVSAAANARYHETYDIGYIDSWNLEVFSVTIHYFPTDPMEGDVDNIVKPILDALKTIAYPDDRQIEKVVIQKFEPGLHVVFHAPSDQLTYALGLERPALYVRVDNDLGWREVQ